MAAILKLVVANSFFSKKGCLLSSHNNSGAYINMYHLSVTLFDAPQTYESYPSLVERLNLRLDTGSGLS